MLPLVFSSVAAGLNDPKAAKIHGYDQMRMTPLCFIVPASRPLRFGIWAFEKQSYWTPVNEVSGC